MAGVPAQEGRWCCDVGLPYRGSLTFPRRGEVEARSRPSASTLGEGGRDMGARRTSSPFGLARGLTPGGGKASMPSMSEASQLLPRFG